MDVVSPTAETGHPQLTYTLGQRVTTCCEEVEQVTCGLGKEGERILKGTNHYEEIQLVMGI